MPSKAAPSQEPTEARAPGKAKPLNSGYRSGGEVRALGEEKGWATLRSRDPAWQLWTQSQGPSGKILPRGSKYLSDHRRGPFAGQLGVFWTTPSRSYAHTCRSPGVPGGRCLPPCVTGRVARPSAAQMLEPGCRRCDGALIPRGLGRALEGWVQVESAGADFANCWPRPPSLGGHGGSVSVAGTGEYPSPWSGLPLWCPRALQAKRDLEPFNPRVPRDL